MSEKQTCYDFFTINNSVSTSTCDQETGGKIEKFSLCNCTNLFFFNTVFLKLILQDNFYAEVNLRQINTGPLDTVR